MPRTCDVAIVGAGVIGCALAAELARRGASVAVFEAERVGAGASYASAGIVGAQTDAEMQDAAVRLGLESRELLRLWDERLGHAFDLDLSGVVRLAYDEGEAEALRRRAAWQRAQGWEARLLEPAEVREVAPGLAREPVAALWTPDGQLSPPRLTAALAHDAVAHGAVLREGVPALAVRPGEVETREGRVCAGHVVVAAGAWSAQLLPVPVTPDKGQRVLLRLPGHPVRHTTFGGDCYVVPRPGGYVLVGATHEPEAGFDRRTTAGALAWLLRAGAELYPALAAAEVVEPCAGLRPATPDGLPLLGPLPDAPAIWLCTGHHTRGVMWAPATAVRMANALLEGKALPAAFAPARFAAPAGGGR
jgi:glycine oxidase